MSRSTHQAYAARLPRPSLRAIGIPDAHDALAVYFHWLRQARYIREEMGLESPMSVRSVVTSDTHQQQESLSSALATVVKLDLTSLAHDLLCVGARFDEADAGARLVGYASEVDILG